MKSAKWILFSTLILCICSGYAFAQPNNAGIGIAIRAEFQGTNTLASVAHVGDILDYIVTVRLDVNDFNVTNGDPCIVLPNGTLIDLDDNLALMSGQSFVYDPAGTYIVDENDLGSLPGADANEVRTVATVSALSQVPGSPQDVTASTNFDVRVEPCIEVDCVIEGPSSVCQGDTGIQYCSVNTAATYSWSISGDGVIVGPNDQNCVTVDTTGTGEFLLALEVCNEAGQQQCCHECQKTVPVEVCGGEGCTPGFWKNNADKHQASAWEGHSPGQHFSSVFGVVIQVRSGGMKSNTITDPTLLEALNANGGGINALARHAVAALLNISSGCVDYAIGSEADLIGMVQDAIAQGNGAIQVLHTLLAGYNEAGCPVNQHGECSEP